MGIMEKKMESNGLYRVEGIAVSLLVMRSDYWGNTAINPLKGPRVSIFCFSI